MGLSLVFMAAGLSVPYIFMLKETLRSVFKSLGAVLLGLLGAALVRQVMAIGLFVLLCNFTGYESEDLPILPFFDSWGNLGLYLPFLLVLIPIFSRHQVFMAEAQSSAQPSAVRASHIIIFYVLAGMLAFLIFWHPMGTLKHGKVAINTLHTKWSRTDRPYDKQWFGPDSGYNYFCLKQFLSCFYEVTELKERITEAMLSDVSILLIYLPDKSFTREEKEAIWRFVKRGGGVFAIGDHTHRGPAQKNAVKCLPSVLQIIVTINFGEIPWRP